MVTFLKPMENLGTKTIEQVAEGILSTLKSRFKILAYHSVGNASHDTYEVSTDNFEKQMRFLVKNDYSVIPLEDAYRNMLNQKIHERTIVITFDDGIAKLKKFAFPILKDLNFPATIFLPVKYIGGIDIFSYEKPKADRVLLNWTSIEKSIDDGISYGSHTMSHPNLVILDKHTLDYELNESRMILKERLGLRFHALAYPFGMFDNRVKTAARQSGYDCALCFGNVISNTKDTDPFEMKREGIINTISLRDFARLVDIRNDFSRGAKELMRGALKRKH